MKVTIQGIFNGARLSATLIPSKTGKLFLAALQICYKSKKGNVTLIDVRPKEEYEMMHIPGANSIPIEDLEKHLATLPINQEIVAYCRGRCCLLSVEAVEILRAHGFKAVCLEASVQEWLSQNDNEYSNAPNCCNKKNSIIS